VNIFSDFIVNDKNVGPPTGNNSYAVTMCEQSPGLYLAFITWMECLHPIKCNSSQAKGKMLFHTCAGMGT